ncbi:DUF1207 domain-containing protein [Spirosoma gilvum]
MKKTLLALLVSFIAINWASAQQAPASQPTRVLTPAEQKQKEKIEREIQRERQIRAEWLQKQREYEAKQAEKERQKQAKKAAKENPSQETVKTAPTVVTPPAATSVAPPAVSQPVETAPTVAEPSQKELREKRKQEEREAKAAKAAQDKADREAKAARAAQEKADREAKAAQEKIEREAKKAADVSSPVTPRSFSTSSPVTTPAAEPTTVPQPEKAQRVRRERKTVTAKPDSIAAAPASSTEPSVVRATKEFLPKGHLFEPILLDPLEAQTYGSVFPAYWTEGEKYKGSIVPFAFGFAKPFYRHTSAPDRAEEWVLDLASFTQFEAFHDPIANKARRRIMNTDYKISIIYNIRRAENNYRIRVYHLSSHLGDDYIFRNQITAPSPNAVNYELLDFTYSRTVNNWRLYGGAGIVLRKTEERKPLSAQFGAFYKKPSTHAARLVGGVDVKFWQQTNFRPGIHGGIGIELGRTQNNLTFLLEGYSGFRPYSQYEDQQTAWIGLGLYLNPF